MTPFIAEIIGTFFCPFKGGVVCQTLSLTKQNSNFNGLGCVFTTAWDFAVYVGVAVAALIVGCQI